MSGDDLAEFKRRFGAAELPLRSLRQVYRAGVYESLCRERGRHLGPVRVVPAVPRRRRSTAPGALSTQPR